MKIVSLLPSATEIVCGLGLAEQLVGVTHECDWPPVVRDKPKVTRTHIPTEATSAEIDRLVSAQRGNQKALYSLDFETIRRLQPDLIVTQTLCDVCAVDDAEVHAFLKAIGGQQEIESHPPRVVYLEPTCFHDVLDNIRQVGEAAGVPEKAAQVLAGLQARIAAVRAAADRRLDEKTIAGGDDRSVPGGMASRAAGRHADGYPQARPKVAVLEWLDPLFSCGHWTPDLVEIAGGVEPLAKSGSRSRRITTEELAAADPDFILIACCGFSVERTMQDVPAFLQQPIIANMRCVREQRVYVTDGSAYFSRPGPRLVDSLEILAHALDSAIRSRSSPVASDLRVRRVPAAQNVGRGSPTLLER